MEEGVIPLDKIKSCTNVKCRLVLPADPDNDIDAGFWVSERYGGAGSRVKKWNSRCKDCVRAARGRGVRRRAETRMVEFEGKLTAWRQCIECDAEGLCLDEPEGLFIVKGRREDGSATHWSTRCRKCYNERQNKRRKEASREKTNARRRVRYREKMADPEFAERRRAYGLAYYYAHPERKLRIQQNQKNWKDRRRKERGEEVRELSRIDRRLRLERDGKTPRKRAVTVVDLTQPRVPAEPFRRWVAEYSRYSYYDVNSEEFAAELGLHTRRVFSVMSGEFEQVRLDVVSRALTEAQETVYLDGRMIVTIDDLYQEAA